MTGRMVKSKGFWAGVIGGISMVFYMLLVRPLQRRWGATDEEVARSMPGDDVVWHPTFIATRGLTIQAKPEEIWPWMVQIGCQRAGWYGYEWVDNTAIPATDSILLEYQDLHPGDLVPTNPQGNTGLWVKAIEPNLYLLLWDKRGDVTWAFGLYPQDDNHTRLISRIRFRYPRKFPGVLYGLLVDMGDVFAMRQCMLGIKNRAESRT